MASTGSESACRARWPWIGSVAVLSFVLLLIVGCQTADRDPRSTSTSIGLTSTQTPSVDDLATAVARILDDRQRRPPAQAPTAGTVAANEPPQSPDNLEVATSTTPSASPTTVDVGRLSVDELSAVVAQILRDRKLVTAPEPSTNSTPSASSVQTAANPILSPSPVKPTEPVRSPTSPEPVAVQEVAATVPDSKTPPTDRAERVAALLARILSEQQGGAPAQPDAPTALDTLSHATTTGHAPAPLVAPTRVQPDPTTTITPTNTVSDEQVARIVRRVLHEQQRASTQSRAVVQAAVPTPLPPQPVSTPSPPAQPASPGAVGPSTAVNTNVAPIQPGRSPSFEELVRAVERILRETEEKSQRMELPPNDGLAPAGTPSSWNPSPTGSSLVQARSPKVVVRMQSSSLWPEEPSRPAPPSRPLIRRQDPCFTGLSDEELARTIALTLKNRARRNAVETSADLGRPRATTTKAVSTAVTGLAASAAPVSAPSVEAPFPAPERPPKPGGVRASPKEIDDLARQIALILKSRVSGQVATSHRGDAAPAYSAASLASGKATPFVISDPRVPSLAPAQAPAAAVAEGEAIAASVGGDAFAFANPFDSSKTPISGTCANCGKAHPDGFWFEDADCAGCGRAPCQGLTCYPFPAHTAVGRYIGELYESICCPDPCYQPSWVPEANAAFFIDYARPQTVTRFRYDSMPNLNFPDRAEYYWAESMYNSKGSFEGKGPKPPLLAGPRGHILRGWSSINLNVGSFYTEAASKRASFFVEIPYESVNAYPKASNAPPNVGAFRHAAGFADMNIGTKSLLFDSRLMQLTFQFRTYFPIGNVSQGLGNGHVSLEPSLLTSIRLGPETYFQGQLAEWIPIGGDQNYAGSILKYGMSFNQVLWHCTPDIPLIGTFEMDGWVFQDGLYTSPFTGPTKASNSSYFNLGPGLRMSVCKMIDFGVAVTWPVTSQSWADPWLRSELRIIY
jgi:hypothetical protein